MGFLDRVQSQLKRDINQNWTILNQESQLGRIKNDSFKNTIILFKHSVSCGISAGAKYRLEGEWENLNHEVDFYYLDLIQFRSISDMIADQYKVVHQSPQIIIIRNGKAVYDTSHHRINIADINDALDTFSKP